jgi:hypothetical protein
MNLRMARAVPALRRASWLTRVVARLPPRQYRRDACRAFNLQFGCDLRDCDRAALTHWDDILAALTR